MEVVDKSVIAAMTVKIAKVEVKIFNLNGPIRAKHIFNTGAQCPTGKGVIAAVIVVVEDWNTIQELSHFKVCVQPSKTTLGIEERAAPCVTETAGDVAVKAAAGFDL